MNLGCVLQRKSNHTDTTQAGKTFTTKQILDYLAWVGSGKGQDVELAKLTDKMLSTTPILEG